MRAVAGILILAASTCIVAAEAQQRPNPHAAENEKWVKQHPARDSTGMVALTDLGNGTYKGEQGGLYPEGRNVPPPAHLQAGLKMAGQIVPLDRDGEPSPGGKIVLMSAGVSNTTMEYQTFQKLAAADRELNPRLVNVDGAQPGQAAGQAANPQSPGSCSIGWPISCTPRKRGFRI